MKLNLKFLPIIVLAIFSAIAVHGQEEFVRALNLRGQWKFAIGDNSNWSKTDFDDSGWDRVRVPGTWEDNGFYGYDGFAWYRFSFDGSFLDPDKTYWLFPGYIDDADETFVNGEKIGKSGSFPPGFRTAYRAKRKYIIPKSLINFKGKNTIAIRVYDGQIGGGIASGPVGIYTLQSYGFDIELSGMWKFNLGDDDEWTMPDFDDRMWDQILVPSAWEKQGYNRVDGEAVYRREFFLKADQLNEDWVLILGLIDDFDKTYVNGMMVGQTNDRRSYGMSRSFITLRIYKIPKHNLKEGRNVISVVVSDMGNVGGIYEGPVGMMTETNYQNFPIEKYKRY